LLIRWRRAFRAECHDGAEQQTGFVPAMVAAGLGVTPVPAGAAGGGAIEIEFAAGVRMRIAGAVDAATLTAAVAALADGRPR
jgi:transposase